MRIFSKQKFLQNTARDIKIKLSKEHPEVLDGMIDFAEGDGTVDYAVNGEEHYLYSVYPEWCDERSEHGE